MKSKRETKNKRQCRRLRGFGLIEVLFALAIIVIAMAMSVGSGGSGQDKANVTVTRSDLRTYSLAVQQAFMAHPEMMKFRSSDSASNAKVVQYINDELESAWKFEALTGTGSWSGGIATSVQKRDAWDNAYGLYVYYDDDAAGDTTATPTPGTVTYKGPDGSELTRIDSCMYIVIVSSGKNGTGGPMGINGDNFSADTGKITSAAQMVNNTDATDDVGVIIRILNGEIFTATFGQSGADLGELKDVMWIYGKPDDQGGIICDYRTGSSVIPNNKVKFAGSLDVYYDENQVNALKTGTSVGLAGEINS